MSRLRPRRSVDRMLHELPVRTLNTREERQALCDFVGYSITPDVRMQVWDVTALPGDGFAVKGYVSSRLSLKALIKACETFNADCDVSRVAVLPDPQLEEEIVGLVTVEECFLTDHHSRSERLDAAMYGSVLFLLREEGEHTLVQSENGYVGWVEKNAYRSIAVSEWYQWLKYDKTAFLKPFETGNVRIPLGARLPSVTPNEVLLPDGTALSIKEHEDNVSTKNLESVRAQLIEIAKTLLETPYVWGGVSAKGIDCSGFMRYIYRQAGFLLPRDADQQFLCGQIVGLPGMLDAVKPGDLYFFTGPVGSIKHVGMAVSSEEFIHADSAIGVSFARFEDEPVLSERFIMAKQILC